MLILQKHSYSLVLDASLVYPRTNKQIIYLRLFSIQKEKLSVDVFVAVGHPLTVSSIIRLVVNTFFYNIITVVEIIIL